MSFVTVFHKFKPVRATPEFFAMVDDCFERAKFAPAALCCYSARLADSSFERKDIAWNDRGRIGVNPWSIRTGYESVLRGDNWLRVTASFNDQGLCGGLAVESMNPGGVEKELYTKREKAEAIQLYSLATDLHKTLCCEETVAENNYNKTVWFRFAEKDSQLLGELALYEPPYDEDDD